MSYEKIIQLLKDNKIDPKKNITIEHEASFGGSHYVDTITGLSIYDNEILLPSLKERVQDILKDYPVTLTIFPNSGELVITLKK